MNAFTDCRSGLHHDVRQSLTDRRAKAIQFAVSHPDWKKYRTAQTNEHLVKLRAHVGPMLNTHCNRAQAGQDLGPVILKAWEISERMNAAELTFQVSFPETATKFTASSMIAKDQPTVDPMTLQLRQTRLKLVITPVITMRDDRGNTIKAKNLHHSTVLTMH